MDKIPLLSSIFNAIIILFNTIFRKKGKPSNGSLMEIHEIEPSLFIERLNPFLRVEIYRYLLSTKYTKHPCVAGQVKYHGPGPSVLLAFTATSEEFNVQLLTASVTLETDRCEIMAWSCLPSGPCNPSNKENHLPRSLQSITP